MGRAQSRALLRAAPCAEPALGEAWLTYEQAEVENGPLAGHTLGELMESCGARLLGNTYQKREYKRISADPSLVPRRRSPYFPLLTKLPFTSDVLSVQVHPPTRGRSRTPAGLARLKCGT
ncbi:MAG: hypothetical protein R2748_27905 [Bryobacterales bacterium]